MKGMKQELERAWVSDGHGPSTPALDLSLDVFHLGKIRSSYSA